MKNLSLISILAVFALALNCSINRDISVASNGEFPSSHLPGNSEPVQDLSLDDNDIRDATFEKLKLIGRAAVDGDVETFKANTGNNFHIVLFPKGRKAGSTVISEIKNHEFAESLEFSQPHLVSNYEGSVWLQVTQILIKKGGDPTQKKIFAYFDNFDDPVKRDWKLKHLREEKFP